MLKVSKVVLSLFVMSSVTLANPTKDMNSLDISKNNTEFIFWKNNLNTLALNDNKMKDTEGKLWGTIAKALGVGDLRTGQLKSAQDKNIKSKKNVVHTKDEEV